MTDAELQQIREMVRQEMVGTGVSAEFADLVKVEGGDSGEPMEIDCAHERPIYCQDRDSFEEFFQGERLSLLKNAGVVDSSWDDEASAPLKKRAPQNCTVIETCGKQTWTYTYSNGALLKSMVQDPDLPGGLMHFDQEGNEIAA